MKTKTKIDRFEWNLFIKNYHRLLERFCVMNWLISRYKMSSKGTEKCPTCFWIGNMESTAAAIMGLLAGNIVTKSKRANRIGELVWNNGTRLMYYYTHRTNCNSNFTVNTSQDKHIKYSKGIPNNSKGRRWQYYMYLVYVSFFSQYLLIVQDATKTTKTCAIEQTNVGGLTSKRNGIEPSGESKNQTSKCEMRIFFWNLENGGHIWSLIKWALTR